MQRHDLRSIPREKQDDHQYLFQRVDEAPEAGRTTEFQVDDQQKEGLYTCFRFFSNMPLNKGGEGELTVNFLEYWEADDDGDVKLRFSRVTDLEVTREQ